MLYQFTQKRPPVPWKDIALSVPFWALMITHTLNNFGWYMLLVELPSFMSAGLGFNIKEVCLCSLCSYLVVFYIFKAAFSSNRVLAITNICIDENTPTCKNIILMKIFIFSQNALMSCIPFLCNWIYSIIYSRVMDMLAHRKLITTTVTRKLSMAIGNFF